MSAEPSSFPIELRPGDRVRIAIVAIEGLHHLILLSREPSGKFTVLAPSAHGVATKITEPEVLLPSGKDAYPVGRPFGLHLLYAILSKISLGLESRLTFSEPFPTLSNTDEDALCDEIAGQSEDAVNIRSIPYEVVR